MSKVLKFIEALTFIVCDVIEENFRKGSLLSDNPFPSVSQFVAYNA